MQRRFTIIQGGLADAPRTRVPATLGTEGWRVELRSPRGVDTVHVEAWRALAERQVRPDPFQDPDFLVSAALHARGEILFALVYAASEDGYEALVGVLPLTLPHPIAGGPARLWQPALAPHPVEPLFEAGSAPAAIEAVIRHIRQRRPRADLHLTRLSAEGGLLRALANDARLSTISRLNPAPIPSGSIVGIGPRPKAETSESIGAATHARDAVERYLLADAESSNGPLVADPSASAALRVTTRLFARRNALRVELGRNGDAIVSGAIWLGGPGREVLWLSTDAAAPASSLQTADVAVSLAYDAGSEPRPGRLRLVAG